MDQMNVECMQIDKLNLVCNSLGQEFVGETYFLTR